MLTSDLLKQPITPSKIINGEDGQNVTPSEDIKLFPNEENIAQIIQNIGFSNGSVEKQPLSEANQQFPLTVNHSRPPQRRIVVLNGYPRFSASSMAEAQSKFVAAQSCQNKTVLHYDETMQEPESLEEKPQVPRLYRPAHNKPIILNGSISSAIRNSTSLEADSQSKLLSTQTIYTQPTQNKAVVFSKLPSSAMQTQVKLQPTMPVNFIRPLQHMVDNKVASESDLQLTSSLAEATQVVILPTQQNHSETTQNKVVIISNDLISEPSLSVVEADSQAKPLSAQTIHTQPTQNKAVVISRLPSSAVQTQVKLQPKMTVNFTRPQQNMVYNKVANKSVLKRTSVLAGNTQVKLLNGQVLGSTQNKSVMVYNESISKPSSSVVKQGPRRKLLTSQVNATRKNQNDVFRIPNEPMRKSTSSKAKPLIPLQMESQPPNKTIGISNQSVVSSKIPILKPPLKRKLKANFDSGIVTTYVMEWLPAGVEITRTYIDGHTESVLLPEITIECVKSVVQDTEKKNAKTTSVNFSDKGELLNAIHTLKMNNVSSVSSSKQRRMM
jgi:hypothetical protein